MTLPMDAACLNFTAFCCIIRLDSMNSHTHDLDHLPNNRVETALRHMQAQGVWNGSFNGRESTLQQLAPFVGKLKTGMVNTLIEHFSRPGDWVCDPFSGCGVVPLEAVLLGGRQKRMISALTRFVLREANWMLRPPWPRRSRDART